MRARIRFKDMEKDNRKKNGLKKWFKRLGLAGFLFFLIKGLVWLAILLGAGSLLASC